MSSNPNVNADMEYKTVSIMPCMIKPLIPPIGLMSRIIKNNAKAGSDARNGLIKPVKYFFIPSPNFE